MRRRAVLSGLAVALPALAGCTGGSSPDDPGGTDTTDDPTATTGSGDETVTPGRTSATLVPREACPTPGEATVSFDSDESISVVGCVVGKNGCTRPRLSSIDRDGGAVTVVVAAVEERAEDEACTGALVNLGYEVRIDSNDPPTSVTVVHDDKDGRRTVEDVTR